MPPTPRMLPTPRTPSTRLSLVKRTQGRDRERSPPSQQIIDHCSKSSPACVAQGLQARVLCVMSGALAAVGSRGVRSRGQERWQRLRRGLALHTRIRVMHTLCWLIQTQIHTDIATNLYLLTLQDRELPPLAQRARGLRAPAHAQTAARRAEGGRARCDLCCPWRLQSGPMTKSGKCRSPSTAATVRQCAGASATCARSEC